MLRLHLDTLQTLAVAAIIHHCHHIKLFLGMNILLLVSASYLITSMIALVGGILPNQR